VYVAPNVEVTVTEKTTSVKKEKVTTVGDQEVRVVESSPTFTETLPPVTECCEGDQVKYATHTHTHTHTFNGPFTRTTRVGR